MATKINIPVAISPAPLLGKSKEFIGRALAARGAGSAADFQLWASLALELLAKASLAQIHPSLIVDVQKNPNSLLTAAGIEVNARVATIGAEMAYARLKHTAAPRFNAGVFESCKTMAEMRNAHLHSGELPFHNRNTEAWEGSFWHACEIILESMKLGLDDWLGAKEALATKELLKAIAEAKRAAAKKRISEAAAAFAERVPKLKDREQLIAASLNQLAYRYRKSFKRSLDDHWGEKCPACQAQAVVGGDQIYEDLADDQDNAEEGYEIVETGYSAEELFCPTCGLSLLGEEALEEGGIELTHVEHNERAIDYGPDYGND
jgi:hypothetical protein